MYSMQSLLLVTYVDSPATHTPCTYAESSQKFVNSCFAVLIHSGGKMLSTLFYVLSGTSKTYASALPLFLYASTCNFVLCEVIDIIFVIISPGLVDINRPIVLYSKRSSRTG